MPLCQVKHHSNLTNKQCYQTCMMLWRTSNRKGLKILNNRCAAVPNKKQIVSREKVRNKLRFRKEDDENIETDTDTDTDEQCDACF